MLHILDKYNIRLSFHKYSFFQSSFNYLGFHILSSGLDIPTLRNNQIAKLPLPQELQALRRFIGLLNSIVVLFHISQILFPLTELMCVHQKAKVLSWFSEAIQAFTDIRNTISKGSVLPRVTDASMVAVGAALHHVVDDVSIPVNFFSKKFYETLRRYSTFDHNLPTAYICSSLKIFP